MSNIKFFSEEQIPLEMHKVRIVQKLELPTVERRFEAITEAGNNTFPVSYTHLTLPTTERV